MAIPRELLDSLRLSRLGSVQGMNPEFASAFARAAFDVLTAPDVRDRLVQLHGPADYARLIGTIDIPRDPAGIKAGREIALPRTQPEPFTVGAVPGASNILRMVQEGAAKGMQNLGLAEPIMKGIEAFTGPLGEGAIPPIPERPEEQVHIPVLGDRNPVTAVSEILSFLPPAVLAVGASGGAVSLTGLTASAPGLAGVLSFALGGGGLEARRPGSKGPFYD